MREALYWLARMLAGGEDLIYVLRRLDRARRSRIMASPTRKRWCRRWQGVDAEPIELASPEGMSWRWRNW